MKQIKHRLRLTVNDCQSAPWDTGYTQSVKDYWWAPEYIFNGTTWVPSELYGHHSVTRLKRRFFFDEYENRRSFEVSTKLPPHVFTPGKKPRRLPKPKLKPAWKKDEWYHPIPELRPCMSVEVKHYPSHAGPVALRIVNAWAADLPYVRREVSPALLYNSYLTAKRSFTVDSKAIRSVDTSFSKHGFLNRMRGDDPVIMSVLQTYPPSDDWIANRVHSHPTELLEPITGQEYGSSSQEYYLGLGTFGNKATFYESKYSRRDYWAPFMSALHVTFTLYYTRLSDEARQDLVDKAWQSIRPTLNGGAFNLANFLIELKDFKSLYKTVRNRKVLSSLKKFFYDKEVLTFRGLADRITELHLQWKFAIAPLVSDLQELYQRLTSMETAIRHYIANGDGQPHRRRKRYKLPDIEESGIALIHVPYRFMDGGRLTGDSVERFYITRKFTQRTLTFTAVYKYKAGKLRDTADHIHAKLDLLGLSLNPATLWNALPFSFVIDWGLRVGDYLEKQNINWFRNISETLLDCCSTESYECSEEVWWINPLTNGRILVGVNTTSYYERRIDYPTDRSPIRSEFTTGEIALGASLAYKLGFTPFADFRKKK